jgi:hypothetical protein
VEAGTQVDWGSSRPPAIAIAQGGPYRLSGGIDTLFVSGEPVERDFVRWNWDTRERNHERAAQAIAVIPAIRSVSSRRGRRDAFVPVDVVAEQPGA